MINDFVTVEIVSFILCHVILYIVYTCTTAILGSIIHAVWIFSLSIYYSLERLRRLLACYNPEDHLALGERYGYQVAKGYGYDYVTGGGG